MKFFQNFKQLTRHMSTVIARSPLSNTGELLASYIRINDPIGFKAMLQLTLREPSYSQQGTYNAAFVAAQHGRKEMLEHIIHDAKLDVTVRDETGLTLSDVACRNGHPKTAQWIDGLTAEMKSMTVSPAI